MYHNYGRQEYLHSEWHSELKKCLLSHLTSKTVKKKRLNGLKTQNSEPL